MSGVASALTELANCTVFGRSTVPAYGNPTSPPIVVSERRCVKFASSGDAFFAIDTAGKLWAWGYAAAEFGLTSLVRRATEEALFPDDTWADVCAGYPDGSGATVWGLKQDGTLWKWGGSITSPQPVTFTVYDQITADTLVPITKTFSTFSSITYGGFISNGEAWVRADAYSSAYPGRWVRFIATAMRYKFSPSRLEVDTDLRGQTVQFMDRSGSTVVAIVNGSAYSGGVADGRYTDYFKLPPFVSSGIQSVGIDFANNHPASGGNVVLESQIKFPGSSYVAGVSGGQERTAWKSSGELYQGTLAPFTQIPGSYKSASGFYGWQVAATTTGSLVAWGTNQFGTTGQGTTTGSLATPTAVPGNDQDGNPLVWSYVRALGYGNVVAGST